jgi:hypothetical protein
MSPADELRAAAKRIREVAGKATPGPWINVDHGDRIIRDPDATAREDDSDPCGEGPPLEYVVDEPLGYPNNGDHIALFDPIAAGHLADWLEQRAKPLDTIDANAQRYLMGDRDDATLNPALALARAINADASAVVGKATP